MLQGVTWINPDNYYGDWWQLGFILEFEEWQKREQWLGVAISEYWSNTDIRVMYIPLFKLSCEVKEFKVFIDMFLFIWWHEYLHICGLNEGQIKITEQMTPIWIKDEEP